MLARNDELTTNSRGGDHGRWGAAAGAGRAEASAEEASRFGRVAIEHVPQGILVVAEGGAIVAANHLAELTFGSAAGRLTGRSLTHVVPDAAAILGGDPRTLFRTPTQVLTLGADKPLAGLRSDGVVVPLEIRVRQVGTGHGRTLIIAITDVTERVRLEARLIASNSGPLTIQRLLAQLTARLASVESDAIDHAVTDTLRQVSEALQLDRSVLWRETSDATNAPASHFWSNDPVATAPEPLAWAGVPFIASRLASGEAAWFARITDAPDTHDRDTLLQYGFRSAVIVPVVAGPSESRAVVAFGAVTEREWTPTVIEQLRLVGGVIGNGLARQTAIRALHEALDEGRRLRGCPPVVANEGRPNVRVLRTSRHIVSEGPAVRQALAQVEQVAGTPATVLLVGETGVGKEVFAQAIHDLSPRHQHQMIRVSCAAIPSALIESELFGRERGAYTGALTRQIGRFEAANHSTLFLDEIGELPAEVQVKLLRVLQERVIERLGSTQPIKVDVRIIAATNRNLEKAVEDKSFREDLFYRLNVFPIVIPPLRERVEDIAGLVWEFVDEFSKAMGKPIESISQESMRQLQVYPWPGNVRELRNVIERAVIISTGPRLSVNIPQLTPARQPYSAMTLKNLELEHIRITLESTGWRIRGVGGAAERLGLKPTTLEGRMAKLGLVRPRPA